VSPTGFYEVLTWLVVGIDAVGNAGGIVEAAICYTGDVTRGLTDKDYKYNLDYYVDFAEKLVKRHIHVLCIKDMVRHGPPSHRTNIPFTARVLISAGHLVSGWAAYAPSCASPDRHPARKVP